MREYMIFKSKKSGHKLSALAAVLIIVGCVSSTIFATSASYSDIGALATNVTKSFSSIGELMIAVSYLLGIGFAGASIFKFKQHKDNPTQIPIGTPIALLVVGIFLIFLPGLVGPIGTTIFGTGDIGGLAGGFAGGGATGMPGGTDTGK